MKNVITYSLQSENNQADFYTVLESFTQTVLQNYQTCFGELLDDFKSYLINNGENDIRSDEEYIYDLLSIGVYWNNYSSFALSAGYINTSLMTSLYNIRRSIKFIKPEIDFLRGILTPSRLLKNKRYPSGNLTLNNFHRLLSWLNATGEFREEVKRLRYWFSFFSFYKEIYEDYLTLIVMEGKYFISIAGETLGKFTPNVNNYLNSAAYLKTGMEDYIFCSRPESDYHLSMTGAELMNIAFRERFMNTKRKALLLPACMKINAVACKAEKSSIDYLCTGCNKNCAINKYRVAGEKYGFEVHIIPHSSDFSKWLRTWATGNDIGVIGVACILNLITGGLEMRDLNIPAQCIFLDYCGCKSHWDKNGIPTDINETQFRIIMGYKQFTQNF